MYKKIMTLQVLMATFVLVTGMHKPVSAEIVTGEILGMLGDTSNADDWIYKFLGGKNPTVNYNSPNEDFKWSSQRTYNNGVLNTTGYNQAFAVSPQTIPQWNSSNSWISNTPSGKPATTGYFSYVTEVFDSFSTALGEAFNGLSINFAADDHIHAIVINGEQVVDFYHYGIWWYDGLAGDNFTISLDDVNWNYSGNNMVEFILHATGFPDYNQAYNPAGLSASIEAVHLMDTENPGGGNQGGNEGGGNATPEPATLILLGLGMAVLPLARHLRKKSITKGQSSTALRLQP